MDESPGYGDHPYKAGKLGDPKEILPVPKIKQELLEIEDPSYQPLKLECPPEILHVTEVKEDFLEIKEESGIVYDLVVSGDTTDEYNTDNKNINLRAGSYEVLMSFPKEETVGDNSGLHDATSRDSGMQHLINGKLSSLSDCMIPGVHHYSRETVTKRKSATIETTHTGSKPYTCGTCHKCFDNLSHLKTHIRIHTGSKPYTCGTCHKCFRHLSNLTTHQRKHTGSKPYMCDTCHKCFSDFSTLRSHIRIHTGSKPYTCDTCHKCYSQLSSLNRHKRVHSEHTIHL